MAYTDPAEVRKVLDPETDGTQSGSDLGTAASMTDAQILEAIE